MEFRLDKTFLPYQKAVFMIAWEESWKSSPVNERQFITVLLTFAAIWYAAHKLGIQDEFTTPFGILTVVVPICVWIAILIAKRVTAPVRFIDMLETKSESLKQELEKLKTPKLLLDFRETDTRYIHRDDMAGEQRAYIRLFNDSAEDVNRVEIFANGIMPRDAHGSVTSVAYIPPRVNSQRINLSPGDECFVKLLSYPEGRVGDAIVTIHHSGAAQITESGQEFRMKLVVVGRGLYPAIRRMFTFGIRGNRLYVSMDQDPTSS